MKEATAYANKIAQEEKRQVARGDQEERQDPGHAPPRTEKLAFKKALVPVHRRWKGRIGKRPDRVDLQGNRPDPAKP